MSAEFFTRETWRASKKGAMRKRTKPWGGRKTAPPALLEAAKRTWFGSGAHRICSSKRRDGGPCKRPALTGLAVGGAHGGWSVWARQGRLQPSGRSAVFRAAQIEGNVGPPPFELTQMRVYREANDRTRMRLARAWGTDSLGDRDETINQTKRYQGLRLKAEAALEMLITAKGVPANVRASAVRTALELVGAIGARSKEQRDQEDADGTLDPERLTVADIDREIGKLGRV